MKLDYKTALIALAAIIVIAIALNPATAEPGEKDPAVILSEKQELSNPPLTLEYWPEGSDEHLTITAGEDASFNLFTVIPEDRAQGARSIDNAPPSPAESEFEDSTAMRDSIALQANETKNKTLSFDSGGSAPLYLVTQPGAAAGEAESFSNLLKEIASLSLGRNESNALQSRLNGILAPMEEITSEAIDSLGEQVVEIRQAKITNPNYDATPKIEELKLPETIELNETEGPLDALPGSINLTVSELDPIATTELSFGLPFDSQVLTRMEGDLEGFTEDLAFERFGGDYFSWFSVDLSEAETDSEGLFEEDEYSGTLYVGLSVLVEERAISVTVKVEHSRAEDLAKFEEVEEELESEEPEDLGEGVITQSLYGKKVFVGIGHNGKTGSGCDSGATCAGNPTEYERNKVIGEKLAEWLESAGAQVYLFDAKCEISTPTASYRANAANEWGADLLVEIHHDSCGSGKQMVFYDGAASGWRKTASIGIAEQVNARLAALADKSVGVKADDSGYSQHDNLGVLSTAMPSILVEVTRVDDPGYESAGFADEMAKAIFDGIASYYGYSSIQQGAYRPSFACSKSITTTPQGSALSPCAQYEGTLLQYMQSNGLFGLGADLGLVESLILIESSCNHEVNVQGLMQVVACDPDSEYYRGEECTLDDNIDLGTQELADRLRDLQDAGLTEGESITLALFGYNRGVATMNLAVGKINAGASEYEAMLEACYEKYDSGALGTCSGFPREDCCDGYGLGARYPEKILDKYASACESAGGTLT